MMNADDSQSPITTDMKPQGAKPSFLGRIGAMIGLMANSEFKSPPAQIEPKLQSFD